MAATGTASPPVISAARFVIQIQNLAQIAFSELSGINSEVEPVEYISVDQSGNIVHTKQFGKTRPPKIILKRALDNDGKIFAWHQMVLMGNPAAAQDCSLSLQDAGGKTQLTYKLTNAWPAKYEVSGLKAGQSELVYETVEIVCDMIELDA
jgi:phage tail-like protein